MSATLNPGVIDAWTPLGYTPSDKQKTFHDLSQQKIGSILFGGARGGGKTAALLMEAVHCAVNFPGIRILCLRRTYPELEESFLSELKKRAYAVPVGGKWNQSKFKLTFANGSEINFSYAETEVDISRILGGEYQLICIDEASRTLPVIIKHSEENLRTANPAIPVFGLRLATNPGGIGGPYLKTRFIKPTNRGEMIADEDGRKVAYIQSLYTDNPYLNQKEYEKILNAIDDPARRAAMRDGDWDAQVGQFFEQWSYEKHVIARSWKLPVEWQRYCGIDYGKAAPWAVCWAALDPASGRMWIYREKYAIGVDAKSQAMQILEAEEEAEEYEVIRAADPSMWGDRGTPMSIADIYGYNGCGIMAANNNRPSGWARCHHFLSEAPACEYHEEKGWEVCPLLHVFGDECPNFVETIPELPRKATDPDDAETKNVPDHMPDAWRYMCMVAGTAGGPVIYENESSASPEDIYRLHEEENAAYAPVQPLQGGGRFVTGDLRMRT